MKQRYAQDTCALLMGEAQQWLRFTGAGFAALCVMSLTGCAVNPERTSLAPPPPNAYQVLSGDVSSTGVEELSMIETSAGAAVAIDHYAPGVRDAEPAQKEGFSAVDPYDRKYVIAYQWGNEGRNSLGLDVGNAGYESADSDALKLEYSFRFQALKKKVERYRARSGWQGMVPVGYREVFARENIK